MRTGHNFAAQSDPARNPQFGRRWTEPPHCDGFKSVGEVAAEIGARLHFRRQIERLHRLGPRATAELLAEIGAERGITTVIDRKIERYVELEPETLEATGGDVFSPLPIREVQQP